MARAPLPAIPHRIEVALVKMINLAWNRSISWLLSGERILTLYRVPVLLVFLQHLVLIRSWNLPWRMESRALLHSLDRIWITITIMTKCSQSTSLTIKNPRVTSHSEATISKGMQRRTPLSSGWTYLPMSNIGLLTPRALASMVSRFPLETNR